jgi:hypothetical protein
MVHNLIMEDALMLLTTLAIIAIFVALPSAIDAGRSTYCSCIRYLPNSGCQTVRAKTLKKDKTV